MKINTRTSITSLVIINAIMFLLQFLLGDTFTSSLLLIPSDVFTRPWIIVTSMFLHGGFFHLFINMYVLLMFGSLLEQKIGVKRFLGLYLGSGIIASVAYALTASSPALGASGAIMGVLGVIVMLMPNLRVLFFFAIPMSLRTAAFFIVLLEVFGIIPGVAHAAHLGGFFAGLAYGYLLKKESKKFKKKFSKKKHMDEFDMDEYLKSGRI